MGGWLYRDGRRATLVVALAVVAGLALPYAADAPDLAEAPEILTAVEVDTPVSTLQPAPVAAPTLEPVAVTAPRLEPVAVAAPEPAPVAAPEPVAAPTPSPHPYSADEDALLGYVNAAWTGDLDGMIERGFIRVLTVHNPLFFSFDGVRQRGFDVEMARAFEDYLGQHHREKGRPRPTVIMIPVPRKELLPALINGRGDIAAANLTITPVRQDSVDFSIPIHRDIAELLVTGPNAPPAASLDDLVESEIFARPSSSYYEHLMALNRARLERGESSLPVLRADERLEDYDLLDMVNAGLIPAVVVDSHKAAFWAQVFGGIRVHEDIAVHSGGEIAWAMRKDSPLLADAANRFIRKNRKGSLLGNLLLTRYLGDAGWVDNALSGDGLTRYRATIDTIKRYAGEYDFDWRMIAAQGYQESKLDQRKVSAAGAVGIMQVMPATAADRNVAIPDIGEAEPNIHAGVKYLRFLRDRYFDDPAINPLDRVLFSLAAYNAGPRAIARARRKAAAMGYNPNVWFGHVEVAAARVISREPVVYVRNIYKYYIAYNNTEAMQAERKAATRPWH